MNVIEQRDFMPLLAGKCPADLTKLEYPVIASPKLDGIRAIRYQGRLVSRKLLDIPNRYIREWCIANVPEGSDGELLLRDWTAPYSDVNSAVTSHDGEPDFVFATFDNFLIPGDYVNRLHTLHTDGLFPKSTLHPERPKDWHKHWMYVPHTEVESAGQLRLLDEEHQQKGYEGTMVRSPHGRYKYGRSTDKEAILLKLKTFIDEEAVVIGAVEAQSNQNEATIDALGHTKRSTSKEGKVPKGMLGTFVCRFADMTVFEVGSGFKEQDKKELWELVKQHVRQVIDLHVGPGKIINDVHLLPANLFPPIIIKHQPPPGGSRVSGQAPRLPVFKGFRWDV